MNPCPCCRSFRTPPHPCYRLVARGWLAAILDTFQTYPKAGLVVPRLLGDTDSAAADTPGPSLLLSNGSLVSYAEFEGQGDKPQANMSCLRRVDVVPSACMVLPRELFKQVGCFPRALLLCMVG